MSFVAITSICFHISFNTEAFRTVDMDNMEWLSIWGILFSYYYVVFLGAKIRKDPQQAYHQFIQVLIVL
jgi:hypothetical protein